MTRSRPCCRAARKGNGISTAATGNECLKNACNAHLVHPQSCASRNNRRRRAHVKRVVPVASRSDNVADGSVAVVSDIDRQGMLLHDLCAFGDDSRLAILARQSQRREERSNLRGMCAVGFCEVVEGASCIVESEGRGVEDELLEQDGERFGGVRFW